MALFLQGRVVYLSYGRIPFYRYNISQGDQRDLSLFGRYTILRMFLLIYTNRLELIGFAVYFGIGLCFLFEWNLTFLDSNLITSLEPDGSRYRPESLDGGLRLTILGLMVFSVAMN